MQNMQALGVPKKMQALGGSSLSLKCKSIFQFEFRLSLSLLGPPVGGSVVSWRPTVVSLPGEGYLYAGIDVSTRAMLLYVAESEFAILFH